LVLDAEAQVSVLVAEVPDEVVPDEAVPDVVVQAVAPRRRRLRQVDEMLPALALATAVALLRFQFLYGIILRERARFPCVLNQTLSSRQRLRRYDPC